MIIMVFRFRDVPKSGSVAIKKSNLSNAIQNSKLFFMSGKWCMGIDRSFACNDNLNSLVLCEKLGNTIWLSSSQVVPNLRIKLEFPSFSENDDKKRPVVKSYFNLIELDTQNYILYKQDKISELFIMLLESFKALSMDNYLSVSKSKEPSRLSEKR